MPQHRTDANAAPVAPWRAPRPRRPFRTIVQVPGSKSETARALVLAALADGPSTITGGLRSRDSDLMRAALGALGVQISTDGSDGWVVRPPARFVAPSGPIDCGLAGTVMRFVPPLAALAPGSTSFVGDAYASNRPMAPLLDGLGQLGVEVDHEQLPFTLHAPEHLGGPLVQVDSSTSSQFISALLLVGARLPEGLDLRHRPATPGAGVPSRPHIAMTTSMLAARGVHIEQPDADRWLVSPGPIAALDQVVEPDLTSAAAFLAAAALTGSTVTVPGWPVRNNGQWQTTQAGARIVDILQQMGATASQNDAGLQVRGTGTLRAIQVDLSDSSELTPVVAALAALATGTSTISGVGHIRGHETDRLSAIAGMLTQVGIGVVEHPDGLQIEGTGLVEQLAAGRLDALGPWQGRGLQILPSHADHRMAHLGALLGLVLPDVAVDEIECTTKTIADFDGLWHDMLGVPDEERQ